MSQLLKGLQFLKFQNHLTNIRLSSSVTKGIIRHNNPNNQNADLLVTNIKDSLTLEDLFSLVNTHHSIMNNHHVMQTLRTIFTLQKQERNLDSSANDIQSHPAFEKLCNKLKVFAAAMEMDDLVDAIKVLTYLKVSSNSKIYQTLLQLLRHHINQLSIAQIVFLSFLLKKGVKTPLSEAILLALPIVFEAQLPTKLDTTHIKLLADCLNYCSRNNIGKPSIELIINALLKCRLNERTSMGVLWSICDLPPADYYEPLLRKVLKNLTIKSDKLKYEEMGTAVTKLTYRYSQKYPFYYNQEFYDVCSQYILENDTGFEYAVHFLRKVLKTGYFNQAILDYTVGLCYNNPDLLKLGDPAHVYSLVCTAALSDYKPKHLDVIKDAVREYNSIIFEEKDNLLRYATSLCVIGVYSPAILEKVLNTEYLNAMYQKRFIHDVDNILLTSQLIRTYKPELNYLLPNDEQLKKYRSISKLSNEFPLEGMLYKVFGGKQFVRSNVYSKMHHFIDHVIVLKKGGFPVAVDNPTIELEDIIVDATSQMILILGLSSQHYTLREKRLKGTTAMSIKTLEDNGYNVVTIDLDLWERCPDFEKIPYVMEQIKQKTDYMERISSFS